MVSLAAMVPAVRRVGGLAATSKRSRAEVVRKGALAALLGTLAAAKINVTATDAVCAGAGRYGVILWVKPRDVKRAAQAFGIA